MSTNFHNNPHQYSNGGSDLFHEERLLQPITTSRNGGSSSISVSFTQSSPPPNNTGSVYSSSSTNTTIDNQKYGNSNAQFSNLVTFYIQDSSTVNYLSCKTLQLLLEVETRFNEIREEISIRILDPDDPFFIYLYLIDFNEYKKIKQNQSLLVSFEKFSPKLIGMIQKCAGSMPKILKNSDFLSSYILCLKNLSRTSLTLDIVELNEFKNLIHLSFEIPSASEEFVRNNYCSIYRKLKNETESLKKQISMLDEQLNTLTISKAKDLQNLKMEFAHEKRYLEDKLKDTEQRFSQEQEKWNDIDQCLRSKIQKLQLELKNSNDLLEKEKKEFEHQYQEWKEKLNQEIAKRHNRLKDMEEKNQQLVSEIELLKIERDQIKQVAGNNQKEMEDIKKDLAKAHDIIRKLQNEVKSCQDKIKILNEVTSKQEEIVSIKESTIERLSLDLKLCLQQLKNKEKEIERLNTEQVRQKSQCSQLELQLSTSKRVINNLTKELDQLKFEKAQMEKEERFKESSPEEVDIEEELAQKMEKMRRSKSATTRIKSTKVSTVMDQNQHNRVEELEDKNEMIGNLKKNFLFSSVARELPLKTVNLRTTNANRNQTNVMTASVKRRSLN